MKILEKHKASFLQKRRPTVKKCNSFFDETKKNDIFQKQKITSNISNEILKHK